MPSAKHNSNDTQVPKMIGYTTYYCSEAAVQAEPPAVAGGALSKDANHERNHRPAKRLSSSLSHSFWNTAKRLGVRFADPDLLITNLNQLSRPDPGPPFAGAKNSRPLQVPVPQEQPAARRTDGSYLQL